MGVIQWGMREPPGLAEVRSARAASESVGHRAPRTLLNSPTSLRSGLLCSAHTLPPSPILGLINPPILHVAFEGTLGSLGTFLVGEKEQIVAQVSWK